MAVRGCKFLNNYRQGMSISSCSNCTFTDTAFSNTSGTWPKCGVDIEPSGCGKGPRGCHLDAITFRRCAADFNDGCGFSVDSGRPQTIAFESCTLRNNGGASFMLANMGPRWNFSDPKSPVPAGWVNITACIATGGPGPGLLLANKGLGIPVNVVDTQFVDVAQGGPAKLPPHLNAPVLLTTKMQLGHQYYPFGGVHFENLQIVYGPQSARFAASMPFLLVGAGFPVSRDGSRVTDPTAAAAIMQVSRLSGSISVARPKASPVGLAMATPAPEFPSLQYIYSRP